MTKNSKIKRKTLKTLICFIMCLGMWTGAVCAQVVTVTGTVTDESGTTAPGVTVMVKGTNIGTVTDVDGRYSITAPNEDAVLQFSFVGYTNKLEQCPKTAIFCPKTAILFLQKA